MHDPLTLLCQRLISDFQGDENLVATHGNNMFDGAHALVRVLQPRYASHSPHILSSQFLRRRAACPRGELRGLKMP